MIIRGSKNRAPDYGGKAISNMTMVGKQTVRRLYIQLKQIKYDVIICCVLFSFKC